jgi:hypothetical protein
MEQLARTLIFVALRMLRFGTSRAPLNFVVRFTLRRRPDPAIRKFFPNTFVDVIQADLGEQLHAADGESPFQFARDNKSDDQRVDAAGDAPRDGFDRLR